MPPNKARVIICISHGVPAQNAWLQLFEADKDCVYLDYNGLSIAEREIINGQLEWTIRQFGDASHIKGYGPAML